MNEEWMNRMESKIDEIKEDVGSIKVEQAKQHVTLKDHTRRSLASEERIEVIENTFTKHLSFLQGAVWVLGSIGTVIGLYLAWR